MRADQGTVVDSNALFEAYKARHNSFDNFLSMSFVGMRGVRRLGLHPTETVAGVATSMALLAAVTLLPALLVTAAAGAWADAPLHQWVATAVLYGALSSAMVSGMTSSNAEMLELHRAVADEDAMQALIRWDRRWFSHRVTAIGAVAFVLLAGVLYWAIQRYLGPIDVHPGTLLIGAVVAFGLGESITALVLLLAEYPILARAEYALYRPNPSQSLSLRRSLQGYQRFGVQASLYLTGVILVSAVLFAPHMRIILPIMVVLLGLVYAATILVVVVPRLLVTGIVRRTKFRELEPLQAKLNELWVKIPELEPRDHDEFLRIQAVHDRLHDTPDDLLNAWGMLGKILGPVVLPTLATVLAALLQRFIL